MCNHICLVLRKQGLTYMAARRNSQGAKGIRYGVSDRLGPKVHHANVEQLIINISSAKLAKESMRSFKLGKAS